MSEKREGRMAWEDPKSSQVAVNKRGRGAGYTEPVWVQPLDPDGPKPGETWEWRWGKVEAKWGKVRIETPPYDWNDGDRAVGVLCEDGDYCVALLSDLRPIKPTRTVTLEVTEEEARYVQGWRDAAITRTGRAFAAKLAEALEAE